MDLMNIINSRYSTKEFDSTKKISTEDMEKIESLLQLSPSSTNSQPWHFVIASSDEGKKRVTKGTQGFFSFNEQKVLDASATIVFATRVDLNEDYLLHVLDKEDTDGRYVGGAWKNETHGARSIFLNMHKYDFKDALHWAEKQTYLNLGNFLLGVAHLGIDALPMEGLDMKALDEEFGLREKGYTASIVVSVGYRKENDFNAQLPKSRLPKEELIERI